MDRWTAVWCGSDQAHVTKCVGGRGGRGVPSCRIQRKGEGE